MKKNFLTNSITLALAAVTALTFPSAAVGASSADAVSVPGLKTKNAVMLYVGSPVAYINNEQMIITAGTGASGGGAPVAPFIEKGCTLVPLRFVGEAFNAEVTWNEASQTAAVKSGATELSLTVGSYEIHARGRGDAIRLAAPARKVDLSVFVPLEGIAEALGKSAFYDRGLIIISDTENIYSPETDKDILDGYIALMNNLPLVGTEEKFKELTGASYEDEVFYDSDGGVIYRTSEPLLGASTDAAVSQNIIPEPRAEMPQEAASAPSADSADTSDFSATNVQVQGVDEADIIKTDGQYIYYRGDDRVYVVKAQPPQEMVLEYTVRFESPDFYPQEIYVDGDVMVVIGAVNSWGRARDYYSSSPSTCAYVYNIADRQNILKQREIVTDGNYLSSRKTEGSVYIVTNRGIYGLWDGQELPSVKDTNAQGDVTIGYDKMYYFPGSLERNIMMITGFNLDDPEGQGAQSGAYVGAGGSIYVSGQNIYVASNGYRADSNSTLVYKFSMNRGKVTFQYKGEVPGTVLNQFSMDESRGFFRIATTSYQRGATANNLYVLDESLGMAGSLEDIAPGETIYSVRFMGDRAYMVTFKTVDPLFAMDLSDPYNPKILGALKIPGYSDYLHPYDDNHLIGFGKDTVELSGGAYYLGMKISMFDVTDITNPREMFSEIIGDRGTSSPLLDDHKALLFSKEKNLLAFPVQLAEISGGPKTGDSLEYGEFTFQGAYVYSIDMHFGFQLKGRITHLESEDMLKAGYYDGDARKYVRRIIFVGDTLYTVSDSGIKATDMADMADIGKVNFY
ncbi:MAG: beta-propeller domain-containing protein [Clostridiales bacterium]|jgi:uncharacterized secreted protein with C-terminal beta-propeller domain|nr:beta-propeller domain-containing protein [Clostridiales bacterium]